MAKPWIEVEQSKQYQSLSTSDKLRAKTEYFESVVAPNVSQEEADAARFEFFQTTDEARNKSMLPSDVKPRNQFMDILGESVRATPLAANLTQPGTYAKAFTTGLQEPAREIMDVPEGQAGLMSEALKLDPMGPINRGASVAREIAKSPVNFAKETASEAVGLATAPMNYAIPAALQAAKLLPVGKTTLGRILKLPPSKIKEALQGKITLEVQDRFIRMTDKLRPLAKHLPESVKNEPLYRGGLPLNPEAMGEEGISVTSSKPIAEKFSRYYMRQSKGGKVFEVKLDPKAKVLKFKDIPKEFLEESTFQGTKGVFPKDRTAQSIVNYAKSKGYDAVDFKGFGYFGPDDVMAGNEMEIRILNPKMMKEISPDINLQEKMLRELKEAKPVRREQEALYTKERELRLGKVEEVARQTSGQSGFQAELAQLKGELTKSKYEPIGGRFSQEETDQLLDMVKHHPKLTRFDTITGRNALLGMMEGRVPTEGELELLKKVFGQKLESILEGKLPLPDRLWKYLIKTGNLSRGLMASFDMSMPFRQGIFLVSKPKQFVPAFKEMFKHFFSEKALNEFQNSLKVRPTFNLMRESKLALTELDGVLTKQEEQFMQANLAEAIPVIGKIVRASNRAAVGFLNKLRADVFDDLVDKAWKSGRDPYNDPALTNSIADFINSATGRGNIKGMERALPVLNATLFSPRLLMSRLNLLNPVYYAKQDPFVRKESLQTLAGTVATLSTIMGIAKLGGAEVELSPYATDFGKIKIGNTRYDMGGGFLQLIRLYSQLISGKAKSSTGKEYKLGDEKEFKPMTRLDVLARFAEYKTAPLLSLGISLLRGTDALGEKVDVTTLPKDIAKRYVPLVFQDLYDLYKEGGLKDLPKGIPAFFGIGVMTYKPKQSNKMSSKIMSRMKQRMRPRR